MTLAQRIWDMLPGDTFDKAAKLKLVLRELRSIRDAAVIEARSTPVFVQRPRPARVAIENAIAKIVGHPLRIAENYRAVILGTRMRFADIFRMAANPGHPLAPACQAWLDEHGLALTTLPKAPGTRGRATVIVTRAAKATDHTGGIVTEYPAEAITTLDGRISSEGSAR